MLRSEYPRPDFMRADWLCLNGEWDFEFDDNCIGLSEHWEKSNKTLNRKINVPYCFQSKLSGITDTGFHDHFWYKRRFSLPEGWAESGKRIVLNFGAVDYRCKVFVNGHMVTSHEGGHIPFSVDITDEISMTDVSQNEICIYVNDPSEDEYIPRGKQAWKRESHSIWYTRTSGIWQSVWLNLVSSYALSHVKITPDLDNSLAQFEMQFTKNCIGLQARVQISMQDICIVDDSLLITDERMTRNFEVMQHKIFNSGFHGSGWAWSPDNPVLFDSKISVSKDNIVLDEVSTYFGMRKIHTENGMVYLNNHPYYLKLLLDQGYWPDGILTAPDDEDFIYDIRLSKEMGFNGCRKHQKIEDPRFLYWADKMGFLVWGELPATPMYGDDAIKRTINEFTAEIERDYNHPCIITWVPLNESWGVPMIAHDKRQQHHSLTMYHLIKSIDPMRLVISNDGWEMTVSDICAIHNYAHGNPDETDKHAEYKKVLATCDLASALGSHRTPYANGFAYRGEPIVLTEFGGIAYKQGSEKGWGYTSVDSADTLVLEYSRIIDTLRSSTALAGFCYTQTTDVEQEINGLMTYDRKPKADPSLIKAINNRFKNSVIK